MPQMHTAPDSDICINHLPNELLDNILQLLDDRHAPSSNSERLPNDIGIDEYVLPKPIPSLKSCSLVCKRWRTIVLPRLFRSIFINASGTHHQLAIISESLASTELCVQFFVGVPGIAGYVQSLVIGDVQISGLCGLGRLLESLPSLRELELVNVTITSTTTSGGVYSNGDTELAPIRCASHTIKMDGLLVLVYRNKYHTPLVQCASFVTLLTLFAEIGELRVDVGFASEDVDELPGVDDLGMFIEHVVMTRTNAQAQAQLERTSVASHPRIRKLTCQGGCVGVFYIPTCLVRLGVLGDLAHLTSTLTYDVKWKSFFDIVLATHSTLTSLSIEILSFDEDIHSETDNIDDDITALEPILSTCTSLESISITMHLPSLSPNPDHKRALHPDGKTVCYLHMDHQEHWLTILHFLRSLPVLAPLRRVKVGLKGTSTDPHILDWRQFREWRLTRLVVPPDSEIVKPCDDLSHSSSATSRTLEKIEVELWQVYDQRWCMHYEMREVVMKSGMEAFVPRFEVPGEDAFVTDPDSLMNLEDLTIVRFECRDAGCRGYRDEFATDGYVSDLV